MLLSWSRACFTLAFRPFLRNEPQGGGAPHLTVKHGEADNFLVDSPETSKKLHHFTRKIQYFTYFYIYLLYLEKYSFLAVWEWRLADVHAIFMLCFPHGACLPWSLLCVCWRNDLQISADPRQLCNVLCIGRLPRYDTTSRNSAAAGSWKQVSTVAPSHIACLISPLDVPPRCSQDFSTSRQSPSFTPASHYRR